MLRIGAAAVAIMAAASSMSVEAAPRAPANSTRATTAAPAGFARLAAAPATHASSPDAASSAPTREIFGYATAGSLGDPTIGYPSWNFDLLSTVAFFSIHVRYDGKIVGDSNFSVWDSSTLTGLVNTAHAHGVKVVVTITGPGNAIDLCDALYNRATTVAQIVNQVQLKGVDGINIDYEGQLRTCTSTALGNQTNQSMLTGLAHDLRAALDAVHPGYYLSIATYSGSAAGNDGFFNIPDLNLYVDSFFIMAYDMDYYGWSTAGCTRYCMNPVSPLNTYVYNDTTAVQQYSQVVGAGKVILGLPYYGRVACVSSPTVHAYPSRTETAATYLGAAAVASSADVKPGTFKAHRDPTDPAGLERWDTWYDVALRCWREMYWDDAVSLGTRYNLANRTGIRGVGFWTLNYGGGAPELWDALSAYFKVWSAAYDLGDAPKAWVAGQPQTFDITLTNSGTFAWPSGGSNPVKVNVHFTSRTGGSKYSSSWLNNTWFSLPSDVAPGASVTFPVTMTAPITAGPTYLEAQTWKSGQFWFTQAQALPVSVAAQTWVASYDMSAVPAEWHSGQSQTFSVTATNKGNVPWPAGGTNPVRLGLHFTTVAGGSTQYTHWLTNQLFPLTSDVAPGASVTFTVTASAPASSGYLSLEAEMYRQRMFWFKQWKATATTVFGAWGAKYDLSQAPTSWAADSTQTFPLTVTNEGTQTWPAGGSNPVAVYVHFTSVPGGSAHAASWLTNQSFKLPADLAPGASVTLQVAVKAPVASGAMYLEAQAHSYHQFWFQQWSNVKVAVTPAFAASYNTCQLPTVFAPGQALPVTLTVTNTGVETWPSTGTNPVELDLHFTSVAGGSAQSSHWLTSQVFPLSGDVAPGASVTLTVTAIAPSATGKFYLEAELFKDHQLWFPQVASVLATVASPVNYGANYNVCATPAAWTHGQQQTFQVVVTNAGDQPWIAADADEITLNVHFTTRSGGNKVTADWLNSYYFKVPSDVAPGGSVTFTVTVAAPSKLGTMFLEAQVYKNHQFWVPQVQGVAVTVS